MLHEHPTIAEIDDVQVWRGELDLTNHKDCIVQGSRAVPLIRGSQISRFGLSESSEFVDLPKLAAALQGSKRLNHMHNHRIATQQVSNIGQRWRLKAAQIAPTKVLANSCNYLIFKAEASQNQRDFYTGIFNSELMNWRFHLSSYNNHVSIRELWSLPVVIPRSDMETEMAKSLAREVHEIIEGNIVKTHRMEALVFTLYGLSPNDAEFILEMRGTPRNDRDEILGVLRSEAK
jgi:Alw26I/Eco31I/Esp3I family type II restriction m6 adenine DNA methyltransferase